MYPAPGPRRERLHELSIATEIYRLAREAADGRGGGRLLTVRVAVGELSAIEPDLLSFAWEAITSGNGDAASSLEIEFRTARQLCKGCGEVPERAPGDWLRLCPRCGAPLALEGGDDLDLLQVSFESEEEG